MSKWIKINSVADLPVKPGLQDYEHIECLIYHNGDVKLRLWNCEHLVWDDEHGDDFYCLPTEPKAYMIIDRTGLVEAMKA